MVKAVNSADLGYVHAVTLAGGVLYGCALLIVILQGVTSDDLV
jgi:hypothetical protein